MSHYQVPIITWVKFKEAFRDPGCLICSVRRGGLGSAAFPLGMGLHQRSRWTHLEDLRPPKLRHHRDVDLILGETITSRLERLTRLVLAVEELARSRV